MGKRLFWFSVGLGTGLALGLRGERTREVFTVDGIKDRAQAASKGFSVIRNEFAQGVFNRERELREKFGFPRKAKYEVDLSEVDEKGTN